MFALIALSPSSGLCSNVNSSVRLALDDVFKIASTPTHTLLTLPDHLYLLYLFFYHSTYHYLNYCVFYFYYYTATPTKMSTPQGQGFGRFFGPYYLQLVV